MVSNSPVPQPREGGRDVALGGARAWFIWSLSAMAFGYAFFQRVAPSVMVSDLMAQFAIGGGMLGVLSALYFYPYVVMQVPLGALLDRMGARLLLCSALSLAGLGSFLFGAAESLWLAYAGRILIGIGSAVGFLGSLALASKWFPPNRFAMLAGMTMFFGMMSGVVAQGPLALFVDAFGWRASQWALGAFGLFLAFLVLVFVRNAPPQKADDAPLEVQPWSDVWRGLKRAASYGHVWKIALVACTMSGPMLTLGGLWGTPYLMAGYGLEKAEAAFYLSILLFGWALGAPSAGWLSDRLQRRKGILVAGNIALSTSLALICFMPPFSLAFTSVLLFTVGAAGGCMAVSFALVRETSPSNISGSVTGIVNGATVASGAALQPLVGWVLDLVWDGKLVDGLRIYETADYQTGFIPVFLTALFGSLLCLTLKEASGDKG